MSFVDLDCGRSVMINGFCCTATYPGLAIGIPSEERSEQAILEAQQVARWLFGGHERKLHVVPPAYAEVLNKRTGTMVRMLPPYCWCARLLCCEPDHDDADGSQLIVVWFGYHWADPPLSQVFHEAFHDLPWDDLAEDWWV